VDTGAGTLQKRSVTIAGHPTSVSLEAAFWEALKRIAAERGVSVNALIEAVDQERCGNLSSALRVFVLAQVQSAALR
jgi:predicted DNA-binding ribbon-helix-helix protein